MTKDSRAKFVAYLNGEDIIPETVAYNREDTKQAAWDFAWGAAEDDLIDTGNYFDDEDTKTLATVKYSFEVEQLNKSDYKKLLSEGWEPIEK